MTQVSQWMNRQLQSFLYRIFTFSIWKNTRMMAYLLVGEMNLAATPASSLLMLGGVMGGVEPDERSLRRLGGVRGGDVPVGSINRRDSGGVPSERRRV